MKALACCVIAMLLTACGSMGGRDQFLIDAGDKPVIYAPGHGPGKDLVVDLPLPDKDWKKDSNCSVFTVSDRYAFAADGSGFGRKNVRLTIKDSQAWKDRPATDRGQPWRVPVRQSPEEGEFALNLYASLNKCIDKKEVLAPVILAIMSSFPRNFDEEIVFQFGVVSKEKGLPLLWVVQLRGGMQLHMTGHTPAPSDIVGQDGKRRLPFGGLSQTAFTVIERTDGGERGLELASGLGLSIERNRSAVDSNFIRYVDSGWYTRDFGASAERPELPMGAYIAYPVRNPRQTAEGVHYWGPGSTESVMFSTVMVLDYTTRVNSLVGAIDLLNELRTKRGPFCNRDTNGGVPIFCPHLVGGSVAVARIQVTTNAGPSWVPVGTLVADVLQEAGWSGSLAGFACPTPGANANTDQQNLMRARATTLSNSSVPLPTLERRFATGLAKAVPATAEALLCAPLLPGDRLSW